MNENRKYVKAEKRMFIGLIILAFLGLLLATAWLAPEVATWATVGQWPTLTFPHALLAAARAIFSIPHPERSWPVVMRAAAAAHGRWWFTVALLVSIEAALATAVIRQLDRIASRPVADRRWYHLRGTSPRTFGRTHTIADLLYDRTKPDTIVIGRHQGRLLAVQKNTHMLVIAPPQKGKTSGIIIPAMLEHMGPVVSTSVRADVRDETVARRREMGRVFQFDPFNVNGLTDFYDPLHGCRDWQHCLRVSRWFTGAVGLSGGGNQDYFNEEAETLLAPFIFAAAWHPKGSIVQVFDWLLAKDQSGPAALLQMLGESYPDDPEIQQGAQAALAKLEGMFAYNERQLDGILGTARVFLKVYGAPSARRTSSPAAKNLITPEELFKEGECNTLYIVADRDDQKELAPIIVMLLSELVYYLDKQHNLGRKLPVAALFALDEAAQIAPIEDIGPIMSASLPNARFMTVWHGVSQMKNRYGAEAAAEILQLSQAKIFLGSNTDRDTIEELNALIGQKAGDSTMNPQIITAQAMQRLTDHEGIVIHTHYPPSVFVQRRYYEDQHLLQLANPNDARNYPKLRLPRRKDRPKPPQKLLTTTTGEAR